MLFEKNVKERQGAKYLDAKKLPLLMINFENSKHWWPYNMIHYTLGRV